MDITSQVVELIKTGLGNFAKQNDSTPEEVAFWIYTTAEDGYPSVNLMKNFEDQGSLSFKDMADSFEVPALIKLVFNVEVQLPLWLQKFILKSVKDHSLEDVTKATYILLLDGSGELKAYMYYDGAKFPVEDNEITLEYILETK